jgi:hypothetical protein
MAVRARKNSLLAVLRKAHATVRREDHMSESLYQLARKHRQSWIDRALGRINRRKRRPVQRGPK